MKMKKKAAGDWRDSQNTETIKKYVGEISEAAREDFLKLDVQQGEFYLSQMMQALKLYYKENSRIYIQTFRWSPLQIVCYMAIWTGQLKWDKMCWRMQSNMAMENTCIFLFRGRRPQPDYD